MARKVTLEMLTFIGEQAIKNLNLLPQRTPLKGTLRPLTDRQHIAACWFEAVKSAIGDGCIKLTDLEFDILDFSSVNEP